MIALFSIFVLDSLYYGRPTLTPLSFFQTNASSISLFYGRSPWHYYLTQGLPILLGPTLPYALHGIWKILRSSRDMLGNSTDLNERDTSSSARTALALLAWVTAVYSCAGHKEWRFLHPMLPLLHAVAAKSIVDLSYTTTTRERKNADYDSYSSPDNGKSTALKTNATAAQRYSSRSPSNTSPNPYSSPSRPPHGETTPALPVRSAHVFFIAFLSLPVIVWVTRFHGHAQVEVTQHLHSLGAHQRERGDDSSPLLSIGFLMPCHSTPGQAYLHTDLGEGKVWSLSCEPPLGSVSYAYQQYSRLVS